MADFEFINEQENKTYKVSEGGERSKWIRSKS